ncbi:MAG TPA: fumarylacetoacetate hydrolase family protein [Kofleriaceae bacterium]|nr:fumarylacetoacetate hydrolase family protein [Kofleriaceae bacterium]
MPGGRTLSPPAGPAWGIREADTIHVIAAAPWVSTQRTGETVRFADVELLAPAEPTKILALAYNYKSLFGDPAALAKKSEAHYTDVGFEPLVFLKGPNCVTHPGGTIHVPPASEVWIEVEVTAIIGRRARHLRDAAAARDVVAGITIGNDVTALNILGRDWHLARSKSLDGFCPLGPELVTGLDDTNVRVSTKINDRTTQDAMTGDRVLDTYEAVALASRIMTLEPGDAILTGTPVGARQSIVKPGDRIEMVIEGIGTLVNHVAEESRDG